MKVGPRCFKSNATFRHLFRFNNSTSRMEEANIVDFIEECLNDGFVRVHCFAEFVVVGPEVIFIRFAVFLL